MNKNFFWIIVIAIIAIVILVSIVLMSNKEICDYDNPNKLYQARSSETCGFTDFLCKPGETYFSDECGCGCEIVR